MDDAPDLLLPGRVVAGHGRRLVVEDEQGQRHACVTRGRRMRAVCGDRVGWRPGEHDGDGIVLELRPRSSALERPDSRGRRQVIVANITQLVVVTAPLPPPDLFITDRYLAAARLMPCAALVVANKADLGDAVTAGELSDEYRRIGYDVLVVSARRGDGLDALRAALRAHTSILVGQSGVGKSSLLNALLPDVERTTGRLSEATGEGRHITTASVLHHLPGGGEIIDSPGVRDYAPPPIEPREAAAGFREFEPLVDQCRFADCLHLREPDCAVKAAVANDTVAPRRYESYRRLLRLMQDLKER